MKTFFLFFFIIIGALDFAYGLLYKDQLSIIAGGAIVAIAIYTWKKKNGGSEVYPPLAAPKATRVQRFGAGLSRWFDSFE